MSRRSVLSFMLASLTLVARLGAQDTRDVVRAGIERGPEEIVATDTDVLAVTN